MRSDEITLDGPFRTAVLEAGKVVMEVYGSAFAVETKDDRSPVTLADRRSHEVITSFLRERYPFPILSEEGKGVPYEARRGWEAFWLVDPLDGTKEFIKRNDEFTINVALIRQGRPVFGVVYVPAKDVLYHSASGMGAYRNASGVEQRLPLAPEERPFALIGSRSHGSPEFQAYAELVRGRFGDVSIVNAGSSLKFCLVAEGTADVYPRLGPTMEWDTAAGQAVVEAAGGSVIDLGTGDALVYNKSSLLNPQFVAFRNEEVRQALKGIRP
jgi:3'(2'), 5'-bisphosphate nucleotidase